MARDTRFDFYKGMLIWGVVWGHTITALLNGQINDVGIHPIMRTYDMPFFMVISGLFFSLSIKRYNLLTLIKNKVTTIALPVAFWALALSLGRSNPLSSSYFVWAVFWSSVIMGVINNFVKKKYLQQLSYILIIIGLHLISINPYTIYNLPYLFPYFVLGYYAWSWGEYGRKYVLYIIPIFVILLCYWDTQYTIWNIGSFVLDNKNRVILAIIFRTALALTGIVVASVVFDLLHSFLSDKYPRVNSFICNFGQETLGIYILHAFVIFRLLGFVVKLVEKSSGNIFASNHLLLGYVLAPLFSLIVIFFLYHFIRVCKNNKYLKYLFGFKF